MRLCTAFVFAISAAAALPVQAAGLSPEAQAIVARVKADTNINAVCKSKSDLEGAVRSATMALLKAGTLSGRPRAQAQEAGNYIATNCGSL